MAAESTAGKVQIYSVEERVGDSAVCVVRCIGGAVRVGRQFAAASLADASGDEQHVTLEGIYRYGLTVEFIDPPHHAKAVLSGRG